jgi:uncharacterized membrane protein (DUF106 family)
MLTIIQFELIGVAVAYSLLLVALQRILINVDRMYEIRAHMNKHQTHLMKMVKENASKEEIAAKQKILMEASTESMKMQFKPMIVTLPLYAVLYYLVLPHYFGGVPNLSILSFSLSYRWTFIVFSLILTMVLTQLISLYDRRRLKDKYNFGLMQPSFKEDSTQQTQTINH